jgi:hypothetical protein
VSERSLHSTNEQEDERGGGGLGRLFKQLFFLMRFEVITEVKILMLVFCVVTPFGLVVRDKRFGGTYHLHFQG